MQLPYDGSLLKIGGAASPLRRGLKLRAMILSRMHHPRWCRLPFAKGIETQRRCRLPFAKGIETLWLQPPRGLLLVGGAASPLRRGLKRLENQADEASVVLAVPPPLCEGD